MTWSLTLEHLSSLGNPRDLPTPPFSVHRERSFDPTRYARFVGYGQKRVFLPIQRAILTCLAGSSRAREPPGNGRKRSGFVGARNPAHSRLDAKTLPRRKEPGI